MTVDDIPEEDKLLRKDSSKPHEHDFIDFYHGWGISKSNDKLMNVHLFCKKCLQQRILKIDISDNDYDEEDDSEE